MTIEEYNSELAKIDADCANKKNMVYKKYALSNNPYKLGDTISDHTKAIIIERITVYKGYGLPQCVYIGIRLNKDGTRSKKQDDNTIYQQNIK